MINHWGGMRKAFTYPRVDAKVCAMRIAARVTLILAAIAPVSFCGGAGPAEAFSTAFFHTQSSGSRGADTLAIQYLLQHHGFATTKNGVFDATTNTAARAFQSAKGLGVDGIVGPQTWGALIVTVRRGSQGEAVKGVQEEAAFRNLSGNPPSLAIDGIFGPKTEAWVRGFQEGVGITVDGIVGPVTWQALVSGMLAG